LEHGLVQVVAPPLAGHPIDIDPRRREDPLPSPLPAGVRILSRQCPRELTLSSSSIRFRGCQDPMIWTNCLCDVAST
jgi:hypothetical protein